MGPQERTLVWDGHAGRFVTPLKSSRGLSRCRAAARCSLSRSPSTWGCPFVCQQHRSGQWPRLGLMAPGPWAAAWTGPSSLGPDATERACPPGCPAPAQGRLPFRLLSPRPLQAGDSLGDGGSVLDFVSVKAYSDVSLGISVLGSLGRLCRVHPRTVRHGHRASGSAGSRLPLAPRPPGRGAVLGAQGWHLLPVLAPGGRPGLGRWPRGRPPFSGPPSRVAGPFRPAGRCCAGCGPLCPRVPPGCSLVHC